MDFIKNALNSLSPVAGFQPAFQRAIDSRQAPSGRLNSAANVRLLMAEKARQARLQAERLAVEAQARKAAYDAETENRSDDTVRARRDAQSARNRRLAAEYDNRDGAATEVFGRRVAARDRGNFYNQSMDKLGVPLPRFYEPSLYNAPASEWSASDDAKSLEEDVASGLVDPRKLGTERGHRFGVIGSNGTDGFGNYRGNQIVSEEPASYHVGQYGIYPRNYVLPQPFQLRQATPEESTAIPRMNNAIQNTFTRFTPQPTSDPPRWPRGSSFNQAMQRR